MLVPSSGRSFAWKDWFFGREGNQVISWYSEKQDRIIKIFESKEKNSFRVENQKNRLKKSITRCPFFAFS